MSHETKRWWFGPPLNSPGHALHGAVPVLQSGCHIGWLMPNIRDGFFRGNLV